MRKCIKTWFVLFVVLLSITSCKDNSTSKAEKIYKKNGLESYVEFVESMQTYYSFYDSSNDGATPFLVAIKEGKMDYVSSFIQYGADIYKEQSREGKDIFDYLKEKSSHEAKQFLEFIPADYWYSEQNIKRLLDDENNYSMFSTLVEANKFSPDYEIKNGKTILMYAAQHVTDSRYIELLIKKSTDINKINNNEWNAVMYAARYNPNPAILDYFLKEKANTANNTAGISLTMLASCNPNPGVLLIVPITEEYMQTKTANGKTALMYACENNQALDVIKILCTFFNENVNATDSEGKTALMYALKTNKDSTVCIYLLESGARVDVADTSGKTVKNYLDSNKSLENLKNTSYFQETEKEDEK